MTTVQIDGEWRLLCMEYHRSGCANDALYPPHNRCKDHLMPINRSPLYVGGLLPPDGDDGLCADCRYETPIRLAYTESRDDGRTVFLCQRCALRFPPKNFVGLVVVHD